MAGIGAGFGAFADGMMGGYTLGNQLKKGMEENKLKEQKLEQEQRNVGTGVQHYADKHDVLGLGLQPDKAQQGDVTPSMGVSEMPTLGGNSENGAAAAPGPWSTLSSIIASNKAGSPQGAGFGAASPSPDLSSGFQFKGFTS